MPAVASTQKPSLRLSSCVQSFILMQRDYEALEDFHVTFHQSNLPWHTTAYTGAHWRTSFGNCLFCQHSRVYSRSGHIYKAWQTLRIIISCTRVKDSCPNILLFKAYHSTLFSHSFYLSTMRFLLNILGFALSLIPMVCAGFDPSSSSNIAVYWGTITTAI